MDEVFDSLVQHVASLSQEGFDALMRARPDVAARLFPDAPDGRSVQTDAYSVAEVLADPDGVVEAVELLSRPEIQVLMALYGSSDEAEPGVAEGFGGPGFDELVRRGGGRVGRIELVRLLSGYGSAVVVSPQAAREVLCAQVVEAARQAAGAEFDWILVRLTASCLVWPERDGGRWRLHDAVADVLPEPGVGWDVFEPVGPVPRARPVSVVSVAAEAQVAATAALQNCGRLLSRIAAEAVPLLKNGGGVGTREVKRLVRVSGLDEPSVRFWLYAAESAGLVVCRDGKLWATPDYDLWKSAEPDHRYSVLLAAWLGLPTSVLGPFAPVNQYGKPAAALSEASFDGIGQYVRVATLEALTACGPGAVADTDSLAEALLWQLPLLVEPQGDFADCDCADCRRMSATEPGPPDDRASGSRIDVALAAVDTVLTEGALIGVVVLGTVAPVARVVFSSAEPDGSDVGSGFAAALNATLPTPTTRVRVQGDMTVVATGLPSAKLADFFDASADRESSGAATVWRISDASVRRWLDDGHDVEELLAGFAEFCDDELPQALHFLIEDAGRRHGLVDVITASTVVVTADATLGTELAALPALARLGARRIAETVLVLDASPQEVLTVLRFSGYLPSAHKVDGSPAIAVVAPRATVGSPLWPDRQ